MTRTLDQTVLLNAIIANPDDDALRLVYADCLQENGDAARAEFIRVQVELHRMALIESGVVESARTLSSRRELANCEFASPLYYAIRESALLAAHEVAFRRGPACEMCDGKGRFTAHSYWPSAKGPVTRAG
jgi:uncharacterized protein (TIGR02996 family)